MKSSSLFIFVACIFMAYALPFEEYVEDAAADLDERVQRTTGCSAGALAALKHYHVDVAHSNLACHPHNDEIRDEDFVRGLKRRELEYKFSRYGREPRAACCSNECDWLLAYLDIDSSVMKCVDRK